MKREIPAVLVQIGSPASHRALMESLLQGDPVLRGRIIESLERLRRRNPQLPLETDLVETVLAAEITGHYRSYQVLARLSTELKHDEPALLGLQHSMDEEIARIFGLLALLVPGEDLVSAWRALRSPEAPARANALELLEHVLTPPLRRLVVAPGRRARQRGRACVPGHSPGGRLGRHPRGGRGHPRGQRRRLASLLRRAHRGGPRPAGLRGRARPLASRPGSPASGSGAGRSGPAARGPGCRARGHERRLGRHHGSPGSRVGKRRRIGPWVGSLRSRSSAGACRWCWRSLSAPLVARPKTSSTRRRGWWRWATSTATTTSSSAC